jgi:hypothetical protein
MFHDELCGEGGRCDGAKSNPSSPFISVEGRLRKQMLAVDVLKTSEGEVMRGGVQRQPKLHFDVPKCCLPAAIPGKGIGRDLTRELLPTCWVSVRATQTEQPGQRYSPRRPVS